MSSSTRSRDPHLRFLLATCTLLVAVLAATPALAQESGFFIGGFGGINLAEDQEGTSGPLSVDGTVDSTVTFGALIGTRLGSGLRIEVEAAYRENDITEIRVNSVPFDATGTVEALSAIGSLVFEFDLGGAVRPYVGGGAGLVDVEQSVGYGGVTTVGSDTAFAFQVKAGLDLGVSEAFDVFVEGRYLDSSDLTLLRTSPFGSDDLITQYQAYEGVAGLRLSF